MGSWRNSPLTTFTSRRGLAACASAHMFIMTRRTSIVSSKYFASMHRFGFCQLKASTERACRGESGGGSQIQSQSNGIIPAAASCMESVQYPKLSYRPFLPWREFSVFPWYRKCSRRHPRSACTTVCPPLSNEAIFPLFANCPSFPKLSCKRRTCCHPQAPTCRQRGCCRHTTSGRPTAPGRLRRDIETTLSSPPSCEANITPKFDTLPVVYLGEQTARRYYALRNCRMISS